MPNEIFNLGLSAGKIVVSAYLMFQENRKTNPCYSSYRTIGEEVGMSRNTVKKQVDRLVEKQLIYTEPTMVPTGDGKVRNGNRLFSDWWHTDQLIRYVAALNFDTALGYAKNYVRSEDPFIPLYGNLS